MTSTRIITLGPNDIDRVADLEVCTFDTTIQASRDTILKRMALGHVMIGLEDGGQLAGAVAMSYGRFDPADQSSFPTSEKELSLQSVPAAFNAAYIYSRGIHPAYQGRGYSKLLVNTAWTWAKDAGCAYVVGNPRTASYAGSDPNSSCENIPPRPRFKAAIDRYLAGGPYPSLDELLEDPSLLYFSHLPGATFHWIIPGFAPHDMASGGIRIIVYARLTE